MHQPLDLHAGKKANALYALDELLAVVHICEREKRWRQGANYLIAERYAPLLAERAAIDHELRRTILAYDNTFNT